MDPGWYPLVRGMNSSVEMLLEFEALIWLSTSYITLEYELLTLTKIFKEPNLKAIFNRVFLKVNIVTFAKRAKIFTPTTQIENGRIR